MSGLYIRAGEAIAGVLRAAAAFTMPLHCVSCARPLTATDSGLVCGTCWSRCVRLPQPQCQRCGHPQPAGVSRCGWCDVLPPFVRAVRSWCWVPESSGGAIVHALKYRGWRAVSSVMAARMARLDWPDDVVTERACLVPVPLEPTRERERGFNQATLLANALAPHWRIPVRTDLLLRPRAGARAESQTRLTPEERRGNVHGRFAPSSHAHAELRGAHVVLVDDVITTAATLNACAAVLTAAGARIVSYVTFGRARASGDRYAA